MLKHMMCTGRESRSSQAALVVFGALLCVLLAVFAVERKVAAYPAHSIAASTTAATGVQKPNLLPFADPVILHAPVKLLRLVTVFAAPQPVYVSASPEPLEKTAFAAWAPMPLEVRPPPTL
jgi:hypothetical protein